MLPSSLVLSVSSTLKVSHTLDADPQRPRLGGSSGGGDVDALGCKAPLVGADVFVKSAARSELGPLDATTLRGGPI